MSRLEWPEGIECESSDSETQTGNTVLVPETPKQKLFEFTDFFDIAPPLLIQQFGRNILETIWGEVGGSIHRFTEFLFSLKLQETESEIRKTQAELEHKLRCRLIEEEHKNRLRTLEEHHDKKLEMMDEQNDQICELREKEHSHRCELLKQESITRDELAIDQASEERLSKRRKRQ